MVERVNIDTDDRTEVANNKAVQNVGKITQMKNPEDTLDEMEPVVIQVEDQEEEQEAPEEEEEESKGKDEEKEEEEEKADSDNDLYSSNDEMPGLESE